MTEGRIPQQVIDKACAFDVMALAQRYGFTGRHRGEHGEAVGPCPGCGGKDRFAVGPRKNVWSCRQGGGDPIGGDAVELVRHVEQVSFPRAIEILTGDLSTIVGRSVDTSKAAAEENVFREKERRRAFNLWREGRAFGDRGAVAAYLLGRGLDLGLARKPGARCREHDDFPYWHHVETAPAAAGSTATRQWRIIHRGPAMLWPITAMDGHFLGLHVTWLDPSGPKGKAEVFDPVTGEQLPAKKGARLEKGQADRAPRRS